MRIEICAGLGLCGFKGVSRGLPWSPMGSRGLPWSLMVSRGPLDPVVFRYYKAPHICSFSKLLEMFEKGIDVFGLFTQHRISILTHAFFILLAQKLSGAVQGGRNSCSFYSFNHV